MQSGNETIDLLLNGRLGDVLQQGVRLEITNAAADSTKSSAANDKFYEQVQNVISDYWRDGYDTEIRFTAG